MINSNSIRHMLGDSYYARNRVDNDFYCTPPAAVEELIRLEKFSNNVWECACGTGNISKVFESHGFNVVSTDLIDRGYGTGGVDFLGAEREWVGDIVTNPPYKYAAEFITKALQVIPDGYKVAMFLKIQFVESAKRRNLFKSYPPKVIYVSSARYNCWRDGVEPKQSGAICYAWYIWEKGYTGDTVLKWFN